MIASLVTKKKSQALTKFNGKKGKANVTIESLPSNIHSMTEAQLRAVAASHGLKTSSKMRKTDIIELLQSEQEKESSSALMITGEASKTEKSGAFKREIIEIESDSESDYDPDE